MPSLTVRLLGNPEVTFDQRPLSFRTRKVLALLIYLLVEGGMHSRESLMALLWPESPSEKAAVTLRSTLSRLRRALQPAGEVILTEAGKVGFNSGIALDLDLTWLASAVHSQALPHDLRAIMALDRGEFLAGFSLPDAPDFDTWAAIQRQACQQQVETVYARLTKQQMADHNSAGAVPTALRWVTRAPLSEAAYRRLMAAHALAGDRSSALRTYDRCRAILQDELGIEPARETAILAESISRGRLPGIPDETVNQASSTPVRPSPLNHRNPLMPFEGRAEEHSKLVAAFRQASQGSAQVVAAIGAAGVGKTRLVTAFQEWAALDSPEVDIWEGRAFETGGHLPYQPIIEALRLRLERENSPEDLLDDVWLAELSQLMPELRARYPDLPAPMAGEANFVRSRIFAAVATLGSALAAHHPAVFILEDMQWADADTRDLVHYLIQRWIESGAPILLLLTVRQENFASDAGFREWLVRLGRDVPLSRMLLDPLSGKAVRQLVSRLADPAADEVTTYEFADWLWAETNGLPFFIEAILHMLDSEGFLSIVDKGDPSDNHGSRYDFAAALTRVKSAQQVPVPPNVRDAILARLERLSEEAAALLLAAAVLGRECSFERLCQVADLAEEQALQTLEALLKGRLMTESGAARRPYTLAHDYIREVVYSESPKARRRIFHRRALLSLEAVRGSAAECAFHAVASLLDEPAFRFSLAAGDEALRSCAFQESLTHYDRAREIAQRMGKQANDIAPETWRRLYQNRGRALELAYQYKDAQTNYREMADLAAQSRDKALKLAALTAQCIIHATHTPVFNPQKARGLGQAALNLAQELNDGEAHARALWCMMLVEFHAGGDSQRILDYGRQALSLAQELGLKELTGYIQGNLSWEYMTREELEAARKANREAQAIWLDLKNLPMLADAYTLKLAIHRLAGELKALLAAGPEALKLSQSIDNGMHQSMALLMMGDAYCLRGRFDEALANFEAARAIIEGSDDTLSLQGYYINLIPLYLLAGALVQAEHWADKLYKMRADFMPVFEIATLVNIARAKIALGKYEAGEAILEQAFASLDREGAPSYSMAPLFVADAHLQLSMGKPERALERMGETILRVNRTGSRYFLAEALWLQGAAQLVLKNIDEARASLVEAKEVAEGMDERAILWRILVALSDLESSSANETQAEILRRQAGEIVIDIAEHTGNEPLRTSFLAQPEVQELITFPEAAINISN
jgi:DNA-binding SARP family transcriptional activator/tetratricopeptide (TPR) repeat protein